MAEEAAAVAQEFISGLDNLPAEVTHLLGEIRTKEERCQELTLRLSNRTSSILKHVRNTLPAWTPYPKEAATLPKITTEFDKLAAIQAEKVLLAERLVGLMTKHVKKLELEVLGKVADLGGVPVPPLPIIPGVAGAPGPGSSIVIVGAGTGRGGAGGSGSGGGGGGGLGGANGVGQRLVDSFGMDGQNKKRRLNALHPPSTSSPLTTSLPAASFYPQQPLAAHQYLPPPQLPSAYLPHQQQQHQHHNQHHQQHQQHSSSASSSSAAGLHQLQQQQQQVQQQHQHQSQAGHGGRAQKRARTPEVVEEELVVEEEDDGAEDNTPYCFCRQKSFGEMVGCDNQHCKIEWFHVKCVDVEDPLPETWFCPDCVKAGAGRNNKKGRKGH